MAFGLATASTFCIIISALFVAFGWRQILRKKRKAHRKLMLLGASFALLFFVTYAAKTVFIGNTS
ncbi:MAG TPA: DUF420 domain-containing protein, partial [Bacilli bacterium]